MALEMCVESYGVVMHAIDAGWMNYLSNLSARLERMNPRQQTGEPLGHRIQQGVDELPFEQAKALWLVDVCGCSYDQAAAEMRLSHPELAAKVAAGRIFIREHLRTSAG